MRAPFPTQPPQNLLSAIFLTLDILAGVRQILKVVLICFCLIVTDDEHFFLAIKPKNQKIITQILRGLINKNPRARCWDES